MEFASFGSRAAVHDMDGAKFFKLCKDTRLVNKSFTTIDVDLIFAKVLKIIPLSDLISAFELHQVCHFKY